MTKPKGERRNIRCKVDQFERIRSLDPATPKSSSKGLVILLESFNKLERRLRSNRRCLGLSLFVSLGINIVLLYPIFVSRFLSN